MASLFNVGQTNSSCTTGDGWISSIWLRVSLTIEPLEDTKKSITFQSLLTVDACVNTGVGAKLIVMMTVYVRPNAEGRLVGFMFRCLDLFFVEYILLFRWKLCGDEWDWPWSYGWLMDDRRECGWVVLFVFVAYMGPRCLSSKLPQTVSNL